MKDSKQNLIVRLLKEFIILPVILISVWSVVYFVGFPNWGVKGFWKTAGLYLLIVFVIVLIKHIFLFSKFYKSLKMEEVTPNFTQIHKKGMNNLKIFFEINMHLNDESHVDIIYKDGKAADKEFILLALLIYARMLRLIQSKKVEDSSSQYVFMQAKKALKKYTNQSNYFEEFRQMLLPLVSSFEDIPPLHIDCYENSIQVGNIQTDELDKYIYLAFLFASDNIRDRNKPLLLKSFVKLTEHDLSKPISAEDAILVPNLIVSELKI